MVEVAQVLSSTLPVATLRTLATKVQETSVNRVIRTGDKRRFVRTKKKSQGGDLLWLSHSADRLRLLQLLKHLLLLAGIITVQEIIDKGGVDSGRRNAIASDIVGQVILGHRVCHRDHRALAHGVGKTIHQT